MELKRLVGNDITIGILANVAGVLNAALGYRWLATYYGWGVDAASRPAQPAVELWTAGCLITVGAVTILVAWVKMFRAFSALRPK